MHRIAAALLIVLSVLALNGGMLRQAFAEEAMTQQATASADIPQPTPVKSTKLLSLLLILESLRQAPVALDMPKV